MTSKTYVRRGNIRIVLEGLPAEHTDEGLVQLALAQTKPVRVGVIAEEGYKVKCILTPEDAATFLRQ
jgi:hypothetical protein